MATPTTNTVDTPHRLYATYAAKWKRCRDASDGQDAIHAAGTKYLPNLKDQEADDYTAYKTRAGFYNATWRTEGGMLGMMFRKPPKKELPAGIARYLSDIDMAGTSLETFSRKVALEVLEVGRVGLLVDHPPRAEGSAVVVAAAEQQGLRPTMQVYRAECIKNWKCRRINNRWMLSQVRLEETVTEDDGEFGEHEIVQYRVLDLDLGYYRQRLFRKAKGAKAEWEQYGSDIVPAMDGSPLTYIPFAIVGTDGIDTDLDEPPLIDLVDLNLAHYRVTADYEHGCHFTGLPTAVVSGYTKQDEGEKFYIGSTNAWVFPDPQAKASFLEFTGQGLDALEKNLARKEQQMAILGARMLFAEKRQVEAAETAAIHRSGENSVLAAIATAVSEALEWGLTIFAQWVGAKGEVVYQLNRDYNPAMIDAPRLTALLKAVQAGQMSEQELFELLQRGDVIDSEKSFEEHQAQTAEQEPVRPVVAANDPGGDLAA